MYSISLCTYIFVAAFVRLSQAQYNVTTNNGEVVGSKSAYEVDGSNTSVIEYLGIPYAQPPVNESRFKPPGTVQNWNEEFPGGSHKPSCPQDPVQLGDLLNSSTTTYNGSSADPEISEDCLYLNIYQPNATSSGNGNAVMVYFHGGDFVSGSAKAYAGNVLSSLYEVIVVTVNYRLGAFGFLSDGTSALPGNYGLMDQQKALEWIKENIQNFGGDPNLITIFGSDAGGSSAHLHTIIQGSSPYFLRAIVQSASYNDAVWQKDTARGQYETLLGNLEITSESAIEKLRDGNLTWEEIRKALPGPWRPVISEMIPVQPREAMVAESDNEGKDILVGSNSLDAYQIVISNINVTQPEWYQDAVRDITDETSEFNKWDEGDVKRRMLMFNQYYVGFGTDIELFPRTRQKAMIARMYTDQLFGTWAHEIAMTSSSCSCNMFKYIFNRRPSNGDSREVWALRNAAHGDELPFVFGFITERRSMATANEKILSRQVMTAWTEFAKTGRVVVNESLDSLEEFSAFSSSDSCRSTIYFDVPGVRDAETGIVQGDDLLVARNWEFWKRYYVTLGFSCAEEESGQTTYSGDENASGQDDCDPGVWSDAGVEMSNETAGALLITFIVLTGFFMLTSLYCCHKLRKAKRKIKKIISDDGSSVISNSSTRM